MAQTIVQDQKKQRYMILVLALIICAILAVVWLGFLRPQPTSTTPPISTVLNKSKVKVDWGTLENEQIKALQLFMDIPAYEDEIGRENPFISY